MMNVKDRKNEEQVLIQIKNLHIHLDEHMDSTNIYNPESGCTACEGCEDCECEEQAIDMDELAMEVCKDVKFPLSIVEYVLQSAEKILIEKGIIEEAEESESDEDSEGDADAVEASAEEHDEDLDEEEKKALDGMVEKLMPGIALLAFLETLSDLAEESDKEDKDHGKSN